MLLLVVVNIEIFNLVARLVPFIHWMEDVLMLWMGITGLSTKRVSHFVLQMTHPQSILWLASVPG
jgi:hypothetical protein